jgi:hypothetical protein
MPQAPRWKSLTSLYFLRPAQPSISQLCGGVSGFTWIFCAGPSRSIFCTGDRAEFWGRADIGTEKDMTIWRSATVSSPEILVVDNQRYMVGSVGSTEPSSTSSPSAIKATGVGRSSAVANAFLLPLGRDCFLSRRLMVSACKFVKYMSTRRAQEQTQPLPSRLLVSSRRDSYVYEPFPLF